MPINLETIPRPTPISVLSKMHAHIGVIIFFDGKLILSGGDLNEAIGQCYQRTTYAFIEEVIVTWYGHAHKFNTVYRFSSLLSPRSIRIVMVALGCTQLQF